MPSIEITRWGYAASFDVDQGPPDPEDFCATLFIDTTEQGSEGVTTYEIEICTPRGMLSNFREICTFSAKIGASPEDCIFGRGLLLVGKYDIDLIERAIKSVGDNLRYYAFDVS